MKLTTGYDFQGYFITEYLDVIFDEMLVGLGFGKSIMSGLDNIFSALVGSEATEMVEKLNKVKEQLRDRVIGKAKRLGANALIGIDFESSKLGDLIMVSMTATAVKIDKIVSPLPYTQIEQQKDEEAARKAKAEEEKQRKLDYIQKNPDSFDNEHLIESLKEFKSTKEMFDYVVKVADDRPDIFDEEMIKQLNGCVTLERMYGRESGKRKFLSIIQEHYGL